MTHPIPDTALDDMLAIVGQRGSGKTYAGKGFVERLLETPARVAVIDPLGVWHGLKSSADGRGAGFPVIIFGGDHADVPIGERSGKALARLIADHSLQCVMDLSTFESQAARRRFMVDFTTELHARNKEPLHLVLDEADLWAPQKPMPDQTILLNRIDEIARRGRVRGFIPWIITQRPAVMHKDILSQVAILIAMKLTAPQDRNALGAWIEGQADKTAGKAVLADLPKLGTGEGYVWAPGHGILRKTRFPKISTFDSSRTPKRGERVTLPAVTARADLSAIAGELADVQAAVDADDPKLLRARIAELERHKAPAVPAGIPADQHRSEMRSAMEEGYATGISEISRAAIPVITRATELLDDMKVSLTQLISNLQAEAKPISISRPVPAAAPIRAASVPNNVRIPVGSGEKMGKAERAMLTAIVQHPDSSREKIGIISGYSPNSGHFDNTLGALRAKGWVEKDLPLRATDAGRAALGGIASLPRGQALIDLWMNKLGKAERAILTALVDAYPRALSREELGKRSGYSSESGHFDNCLGRLRTLELATRGPQISASEHLF